MKTVQMSFLQEGQSAKVATLVADGSMGRRLLDLGMIPGTRIDCVRKAPSGSPIIYQIRGAMMALRSCDAAKILVEMKSWD